MTWANKAKGGSSTTEGVIADYVFMDRFPFGDDENEKPKKGKKDSDGDESIYMLLSLRPDGVDEGDEEAYVKRSLYLGSSKYLVIEDEGKTLASSDDDGTPRLYEGGEVFKFIESLETAGFPAEARFPDITEEKKINFEGMLGWRIRVVNEIDVEATKKLGKRKVTAGKHKGKEFNRTYTKVTKVFGEDEVKAEGGKPNGKIKTSKSKKDEDADAEQYTVESPSVSKKAADKFLLALIEAQPKETLPKKDIALQITRYATSVKMDRSERDAMRAFIVADDFAYIDDAAEREVVEVDKKGVISAA
jgi:hypothetical protein